MRHRANLYIIDRIEYVPLVEKLDIMCLAAWISIALITVGFWVWVML